ncbi:MAG: ankyrin repeat domain-containing protein [Terriglobia bacterium]
MNFEEFAAKMREADKQFPLHLAARDGDLARAEDLIRANPNLAIQKNYMGDTPLHKAAQFGRGRAAQMAKLLLSLGKADVNARDSSGKTALHRAVNNYEEEIEVVKVLCENGADVSAKDSDGFTPLHEAAGGKKDIVELLLAYGADPNAEDEIGVTPLRNARDDEIAQLLRRHGARE